MHPILSIKAMRYNIHLLESLNQKKNVTIWVTHEDEEQGTSFVAGGKAKWCSHFGRQFGSF
jgi:hypothetical protein